MAEAAVNFALAVTVQNCHHGPAKKRIASFPSYFSLKDIFENVHTSNNEACHITVKGANSISAAATDTSAYELDLSLSVQNIHDLGVKHDV